MDPLLVLVFATAFSFALGKIGASEYFRHVHRKQQREALRSSPERFTFSVDENGFAYVYDRCTRTYLYDNASWYPRKPGNWETWNSLAKAKAALHVQFPDLTLELNKNDAQG